MSVAQILKEKGAQVVTVDAEATVAEAAALLAEHRIGAVLVCDDEGRVSGLLSERDIVRGLVAQGEALLAMTVGSLMTRDVVTIGPGDSIDHVRRLMTDHRIRHLPVLNDGRLAGIVSIGDVVKHRLAEIEAESEALKDYIRTG